jgi:hypothetical protein
MIDVDACRKNAIELCLVQGGELNPEEFRTEYRHRLISAGRWFMSIGLATSDKYELLGWLPRPILWQITHHLIGENSLSRTLAGRRGLLARPEAAQHFTTWLGYLITCFRCPKSLPIDSTSCARHEPSVRIVRS